MICLLFAAYVWAYVESMMAPVALDWMEVLYERSP